MIDFFENHLDDKVAVILESTGKIKSVKSLFSRFGFSDFEVVATYGRLFDLPVNELGFDPEDFSKIKRIPIHQNRIDFIRRSISEASLVLVITDDDIEGELIASDVFHIATMANHKSEKTLFRIRLKSISFQQFSESLGVASGINNDIVMGALARRTFDRICGYSISSNNYASYTGLLHGRVGRVLTPLLSILRKNQFNSQSFGYVDLLDQNGQKWCLEVSHRDNGKIASICELLSSIKAPCIKMVSSELLNDGASPMNYGSALSSLSRASGISIKRTSECLQDLYQSGAISYHRTDSSVVSKSSADEIGRIAFNHGVIGFSSETLMSSGESLSAVGQNAHHGIVPLSDVPSLYANKSSLSEQDFLLMLIWRNIIRAGQSNRMIEIHKAEIDLKSSVGQRWLSHLEGFDYSISRSEAFILGSNRRSLINDRIYVHGSDCTKRINDRSGFYIEKNDHKILRFMMDNDLGRPSTFPVHASSIGASFLDSEGSINSLGIASLLLAEHFCGGLIAPETAKKIEHQLHFGSENIKQRIEIALSMAQINFSKDMLNSSKISSENEINFVL